VVRYVVQPQGDKNTVLRIDALFRETFRRTVHQSDGSVESAEYKDIHDHLESIELMKRQTIEAQRERQEQLKKKKQNSDMKFDVGADETETSSSEGPPSAHASTAEPAVAQPAPIQAGASQTAAVRLEDAQPGSAEPGISQPLTQPDAESTVALKPGQSLEDHVKELRKQVQRLVKAPGAPLKSAPFHTASTLQSLPTGTEILIVISTPYWYGVETHEGQHGWMLRDDLEQQP
jgi:polyhydroxyalkanoate synthesis regulator phasin